MIVGGSIDVLVTSAGHGPKSPVLEISDDDWHQAMQVYLVNVICLTRRPVTSIMHKKCGARQLCQAIL